MAIRSPKTSASSMWWVESKIVRPKTRKDRWWNDNSWWSIVAIFFCWRCFTFVFWNSTVFLRRFFPNIYISSFTALSCEKIKDFENTTYRDSSSLPGLYCNSKSQIALRAYGSTPAVGSSRITVLEPATNAMETDNFLFIPPDKYLDFSFRLERSPDSARNLFKKR